MTTREDFEEDHGGQRNSCGPTYVCGCGAGDGYGNGPFFRDDPDFTRRGAPVSEALYLAEEAA